MIPRRHKKKGLRRVSSVTIWFALSIFSTLFGTYRLTENVSLSSSKNNVASQFLVEQSDEDISHQNGTIVVQLSGEMGNNLNKLSFAKGLQLMGKERHNLRLNLVLRHQNHNKWMPAKRNLQRCFPNLRSVDFKAGNKPEYDEKVIEQKILLGSLAEGLVPKGNDASSMWQVVDNLNQTIGSRSIPSPNHGDNIRIPYIFADQMVEWQTLDQYRDEILEWLKFDYEACCPQSISELPRPTESVFHFRNFVTELQGVTSSLGFDELSPERTARELFRHLKPGDEIAITTRFNNDVTQQYVQALKERGLTVRVIAAKENQEDSSLPASWSSTATADFCFLAKAQKELVGGQRSSFFTWAAYLGLAEKKLKSVRSYSVDYSSSHDRQIRNPSSPNYRWSNSEMREKWKFETYPAET